jgi:transposase InsO family protein
MRDASSRPRRSPRAIRPQRARVIVEVRRRCLTPARTAQSLAVSESTLSRVPARAGLSHLRALVPSEPAVRCEHAHPGDLVHIDTKKLGRIVRTGQRITDNRRDSVDGAGWEFLFVAVDDHARFAFTQTQPDARRPSAIGFLNVVVEHFAGLGTMVRRILTDNGSAFRSKRFAHACTRLGLKHSLTRPDRPQTNGKAERFIQFALRQRACGIAYRRPSTRAAMLKRWTHHDDWHRPYHGIGGCRTRQPTPAHWK